MPTYAEPRVAVVTGAESGIGAAVATRLRDDGLTVVSWDLRSDPSVDVTDYAAVERAAAAVREQHGPVSVLVNCAGMIVMRGLLELAVEDWRRQIAVNLDGTFHCLRAIAPQMVDAGRGAIVNIASIYGVSADVDRCAYIAAKHGVVGLTEAAAKELGGAGVRVNAIAPGIIETPMNEAVRQSAYGEQLLRRIPAGRWGRAEEVAQAVAFLSGEESEFVNGVVLTVAGGQVTH